MNNKRLVLSEPLVEASAIYGFKFQISHIHGWGPNVIDFDARWIRLYIHVDQAVITIDDHWDSEGNFGVCGGSSNDPALSSRALRVLIDNLDTIRAKTLELQSKEYRGARGT